MLGQLFQSINTGIRRSGSHDAFLHSQIEEGHTRSLLFPDGALFSGDGHILDSYTAESSLQRSYSITDYVHEPLDLDASRDIRILIAQDHDSLQQKLLFDSKPSPPPESPRIGGHSRSSSRTENVSTTGVGSRTTRVPTIPEYQSHSRSGSGVSVESGVFQRAGKRKGSMSSIYSVEDSFQNKASKESSDIPGLALSCMFEVATSTYKGPSTKVHIVPITSKPYDNVICSPTMPSAEAFAASSLGKSSMVRRPSALSRSLVPGEIEPELAFARSNSLTTQTRRTVLVTRTFSVPWIEDDFNINMDSQRKNVPLPVRNSASGKHQPMDRIDSRIMSNAYRRPWRSLMYAVTIVLSLPIDSDEISPPISRTGTFGRKTLGKDFGNRNQALYGSSAESERRFPFLPDNLADSITTTSDVDDKVALIGEHWDIFARVLTTLQYLAQRKIYDMLKRQAANSRNFKLPSMALGADDEITKAADDACVRVVRGMKINRVRTGQGLWPNWREEARLLANWSNGRDKNFFFLTVITAFLGTHTDWLRSLAPKWYRKKYKEQHRHAPQPDAALIPTRTIIVAKDRMAARRLIFLLSAFLPSNKSIRGDQSPLRPGTATSWRAYSQSPPKPVLVRQESLRKTINRRNKRGTSMTRYSTKSRASSIIAAGESHDDRTETGTIRYDQDHHVRRDSDARSIRSKVYLPEHDAVSQKADTTTATVAAGPVIMRPHFTRQISTGQTSSNHSRSNSAASASLLQPLQRTSSIGSDTQWTNKWGSSFRNLWSMTRRQSSSGFSDTVHSTDEGLGISDGRGFGSPSRLQQMADDVQNITSETSDPQSAGNDHPGVFPSPELTTTSPQPSSPSISRRFSKPIDVPMNSLKMSRNKEDGVYDVEIPLLEFGSPIYSPGIVNEHSGSSFGESSFGQHSWLMNSKEPEKSPNVGGWLEKVHPDLALQAVNPYTDVMKDIKAAMSAEPNPALIDPAVLGSQSPIERWLDICTALVADTQSWTVSRVHLRRLVRFIRQSNSSTILTPVGLPGARNASIYGNPYHQPSLNANAPTATAMAEFIVEEKFTEEIVSEHEGAFAEAIERVLSLDGNGSTKGSSSTTTSSSRSSSFRGRTHEINSPRDIGAIIMGQLESITADVANGLKEKSYNLSTKDTLLKEGIKSWLSEIDTKYAAVEKAKVEEESPTINIQIPQSKDQHKSGDTLLTNPRTQSSDESAMSQVTLKASSIQIGDSQNDKSQSVEEKNVVLSPNADPELDHTPQPTSTSSPPPLFQHQDVQA